MKSSIIVNPAAGGGRTGAMWGEIRDEVRSRLGGLEELTTSKAGDATRMARQIAQSDTELLIIGGGDGTINEVVNGLFNEQNEPLNSQLKIGILSAGRGCDFIRSVDIPDDYRRAVDILVNPQYKAIDVGCCYFRDEFGREQKRLFMNVATVGLGGIVAKRVNRTPRFIPPQLAYFTTVAGAFLMARGQYVKVSVDEKVVFDGKILNVFIANGGYSGAGMCWAPAAKLDDGKFEVIIAEPVHKTKIALAGHRLYDGTFVNMPGVTRYQGKSVFIDTADDVYLEMDGEQPGLAPAAFTVLGQALNLAVSEK